MVLQDWDLKYRLNLLKDTFNVRQHWMEESIIQLNEWLKSQDTNLELDTRTPILVIIVICLKYFVFTSSVYIRRAKSFLADE